MHQKIQLFCQPGWGMDNISLWLNILFMWNLKSASKITEEKFQKKSHQIHMDKLKSMRPIMKITPPEQPEFVYTKPKQEMSRRNRLTEIDKHNEILVTKMQLIRDSKYTQNKLRPQAQHLKTLNQHIVNVQVNQIETENKRICDKLLKIKSYYPALEIIDHSDNLQKVKTNISENARRVKSSRSLCNRPQSSTTTRSSKFYRSKVNKFDTDGNISEERVHKFYKMASQEDFRPQTAPSFKRRNARQYSSEKHMKLEDKIMAKYQQNNEEDDLHFKQEEKIY